MAGAFKDLDRWIKDGLDQLFPENVVRDAAASTSKPLQLNDHSKTTVFEGRFIEGDEVYPAALQNSHFELRLEDLLPSGCKPYSEGRFEITVRFLPKK